ncbi:hypothetical protein ABIF63_000051 [Bradyrhizobium japonicum]|uniref:Uncharacterized protein n=1 Tax=Bradyrhizobium japonicum TaxID=375 RepID=A0ABV2RGA0_BRAJP
MLKGGSGSGYPFLKSALWMPLKRPKLSAMVNYPHDYYVFTSRRGDYPARFIWEIRRRSKPLGIKLTADGFETDRAAISAGRQALTELLADLYEEEARAQK